MRGVRPTGNSANGAEEDSEGGRASRRRLHNGHLEIPKEGTRCPYGCAVCSKIDAVRGGRGVAVLQAELWQ